MNMIHRYENVLNFLNQLLKLSDQLTFEEIQENIQDMQDIEQKQSLTTNWQDFTYAYNCHVTQKVDVYLSRLSQLTTQDWKANKINSKKQYLSEIKIAMDNIVNVLTLMRKYGIY